MKRINYPSVLSWAQLCERPQLSQKDLEVKVNLILDRVNRYGDFAIREYNQQFDGIDIEDFAVASSELQNSKTLVSNELKNAITIAANNIRAFHQAQKVSEPIIETMSGVRCWRKSSPIQRVGLYIPGGTAPLFSTVLMLAIPALLVGCEEIIICTPADEQGNIHPAILYTAQFLGLEKVYKIGGAQAIAAMAYGTETVPKVDKIFGPGNQYVTKAKELVQKSGVAIDLPAGPSEVLVIADATADPDFVAADLLSQAEHGADSQVILVSTDYFMANAVEKAIERQLDFLPRRSTAEGALKNSRLILLETLEECVDFSNTYAPEHLILAFDQAMDYTHKIQNAGSVFIGHYSCESAGDYASGTNHTLPTNGYAKSYSGVSMDSFVKKITFQEISSLGIQTLGPTIEIMAEAEELIAHKNAVSIRLKKLNHAN